MKLLQLIATASSRLSDKLMQKRSCVANNRRKVILMHDNVRPHLAKSVKQTLLQLKSEILPHSAYSPDLAPSDYHLFRLMQHALTDTHFSSYEKIKKWVDEWIERYRVLPSWNCPVAGEMGKDSRKWRELIL